MALSMIVVPAIHSFFDTILLVRLPYGIADILRGLGMVTVWMYE